MGYLRKLKRKAFKNAMKRDSVKKPENKTLTEAMRTIGSVSPGINLEIKNNIEENVKKLKEFVGKMEECKRQLGEH